MPVNPIRLRMGGYQGPKSILTAGLTRFAEEATKLLGETIAIERIDDVTRAGSAARDLFDGIENGAFDIGYMASGYMTARVPELAVIDLPFSQSDRHVAYCALDGVAGAILRGAIETGTGYRLLGFWDNGFRHLTNHVRPIRTSRDCAGLIVRTLDNQIYQDTMAAMGFTPVVTDVRELRDAVMSGRVDAQENPLTNSVVFELYRRHRHLSMTGHFFGVVLFVANADWYASLPEPVAHALSEAARLATQEQRRLAQLQDAEALAVLRGEGLEIIPADEIDRDGFQAACADIVKRELARLDPALVRAYLGRPPVD